MTGFTIKKCGIGDAIQFTSLPENYFRATGEKLVDVSNHYAFDHNPYVTRSTVKDLDCLPIELWNYPKEYEWARPRPPKTHPTVYLSNAEIHASLFKVPVVLNRPRLYKYEEFPFEKREMILFHTHGRSHGVLPDHVIDHVVQKYKKTAALFHIGFPSDPDIGIPRIGTPTIWHLAREISQAKMVIGVDSGPTWIAACYPDVVVKKIRTKFQPGYREAHEWTPLEIDHHHSFWDDRAFQIFNITEDDIGFTRSYKSL